MDTKVFNYRVNHPKCKYCKFLKHVIPHVAIEVPSYYECKAKDRVIKYPSLPRYLCSCYRIKEVEI